MTYTLVQPIISPTRPYSLYLEVPNVDFIPAPGDHIEIAPGWAANSVDTRVVLFDGRINVRLHRLSFLGTEDGPVEGLLAVGWHEL